MNESTISDTTILQGTTFVNADDKGRVQLQYILPSGRTITSTDRLVPNEIKGKVLIAWANAIRAEDSAEIKQREDEAIAAHAQRRALRPYSDAPTATPPSAPASSAPQSMPTPGSVAPSAETSKASSTPSTLPDSPDAMITEKCSILRTREGDLTAEIARLSSELEQTLVNLEKWAAIARALGVALTPTNTSASEQKPKPRRGRPRKVPTAIEELANEHREQAGRHDVGRTEQSSD
jgi:hypothetical protein